REASHPARHPTATSAANALRFTVALTSDVGSVRLQLPGCRMVNLLLENPIECLTVYGIVNRRDDLDAAGKVATTPIRRPDVELRIPCIVEPIDAGMLEKPPDDGDHPDVLGQPRHHRTQ